MLEVDRGGCGMNGPSEVDGVCMGPSLGVWSATAIDFGPRGRFPFPQRLLEGLKGGEVGKQGIVATGLREEVEC